MMVVHCMICIDLRSKQTYILNIQNIVNSNLFMLLTVPFTTDQLNMFYIVPLSTFQHN